ncbi:uncharacterized protein LOC126989931 [Eriocheir sinensis]|uniref:uncharacterized protein LOC126989931 n=1 Tax=Eriocheir sinensis TaxID=95602 RepID=UPI0021C7058A|nr:uncharacterized protein LOC126989931 [Eriocheir sinensis]
MTSASSCVARRLETGLKIPGTGSGLGSLRSSGVVLALGCCCSQGLSLLKSFCKTPDGFRVDFRSGKIQPGETYEQFSIQLGRSFEQCPKNPRAFKDAPSSSVNIGFCWEDRKVSNYCVAGTINGAWTSAIIRDAGCSSLIVSEEALPDDTCPSLGAVRAKATAGLPDVALNGASYKFSWTNGLLYRDCVASSRPGKVGTRTLVLPSDCRQIVLQVAHESPLAGHFSHRKTESKVSDNFFWPGMGADIRDYCRSCDICQRFPEAIPLKDVDSVSVAEALLSSFSRVGIPREILSDRVHHTVSSEWEMPSDRTGLSALDLLYGRTVRGPLTVLKDLWEDRDLQEEERTSLQYVIELREKLTECAQLAAREADVSTAKYKSYFDLRSQDRQFKPGDEVLVLLPDSTKKFLVSWRGPFKVLERRNKVDYLVDDPRGPKLYHANLLKRYHRRAQVNFAYVKDDTSAPDDDCSPTGPLEAEDPDDLVPCPLVCSVPDSALNPALDINKSLEWNQRSSLEDVLSTFKDVFSETPGCTNTLQHDIILTTTNRVLTKNYPGPIHLRPYFEKEFDNLLQLGIIQPSSSLHCSPVVMVRKSDGSYRMAIDFRQLNSVTVFDAEPTCSVEGDLHKFAGATYFSELDLCKAYYQIPLTDRAKPLTAFSTHQGLMEFCL